MTTAKGTRGERFGIMNHVGSIWTVETFETEEEAARYLVNQRGMWADRGWGDLAKHHVVPVRVTVTPIPPRKVSGLAK